MTETRLRWAGNIHAQEQADSACAKLKPKKKKLSSKQRRRAKRKERETAYKHSPKKVKSYDAYLASKHWKHTRQRALRHYRECEICGETTGLHVHHKHYKSLGKEVMEDLQVLCVGCHENRHEGEVFGVFDPMTRAFLEIIVPARF